MQSIFLCNPKIIMSWPLPASGHPSQGRKAKQARPPPIWISTFWAPKGGAAHGSLCSPLVAHLPLSSPVGWPHTSTFLGWLHCPPTCS